MTRLITSTLSAKAQLTIPKEVRALLGVGHKGDTVGFLVDTESGSVRLARVDTTLYQGELSPEECRALLKLRRRKGGKRFKSVEALIGDLKARRA